MHVFGCTGDRIQRWRLADGQEAGKQTGMKLYAISVSRDHKWIVCGTREGASVWDGELHKKVIDVKDVSGSVMAVDVSSDSTRFATGTGYPDKQVSIWSLESGKRLVGPLKHVNSHYVTGVKFSPNGEHIATTCGRGSIRIFDSRNGDLLITVETTTRSRWPITPLAWSKNGQQIFTASDNDKIRSFDPSTGTLLAESQTLNGGNVESIALATNGMFIATFAGCNISFLDASTLKQICPDIEESERIESIALSPDSSHLATGRRDGKVAIHNLSSILPDLAEAGKSSSLKSETHSTSEDGGGEILEVEVPSSTPALQFDFDEVATISDIFCRSTRVRGHAPWRVPCYATFVESPTYDLPSR
ncbi:hypothetical protein J3R83DRAFT_5121 [Lanmaoa asiatica]|nr:hypothetical protein J3R83DRAFT_5121 [Lanmaoa asiatica]